MKNKNNKGNKNNKENKLYTFMDVLADDGASSTAAWEDWGKDDAEARAALTNAEAPDIPEGYVVVADNTGCYIIPDLTPADYREIFGEPISLEDAEAFTEEALAEIAAEYYYAADDDDCDEEENDYDYNLDYDDGASNDLAYDPIYGYYNPMDPEVVDFIVDMSAAAFGELDGKENGRKNKKDRVIDQRK